MADVHALIYSCFVKIEFFWPRGSVCALSRVISELLDNIMGQPPLGQRHLLLGILGAACLFSASASAGDAEGRYAVKGLGLAPCKALVEGAEKGEPAAAGILAWFAGYLTGVNMVLDNTYDIVSWQEGTLPGILVATCANMPDQPVAAAAVQVLQVLAPQRIPAAEKPEEIVVGEQKRLLYPSVVRAMQQALKDRGQSLVVDGDFGPGTRSAISAFQTANGLPATGFPDARTMVALMAGMPPGAAPPQ